MLRESRQLVHILTVKLLLHFALLSHLLPQHGHTGSNATKRNQTWPWTIIMAIYIIATSNSATEASYEGDNTDKERA